MKREENILIVADSERDADMLYAVRLFVPDPFIYLRLKNRSYIVMNDLEVDRARKQARHCHVISLSRCLEDLRRRRSKSLSMAAVIQLLLRENRQKRVWVPPTFPLGLAEELRTLNVKIQVKKGGIFPQREVKRVDEVKKISAALMMAEVGLAEGIQALKRSKIGRDGKLIYHGLPLTSEKLRAIIDIAIIQAGGLASHTIVAGGAQGCDPHEQGHGPLRAHEPIILDVFPRSQKTGYFGDITRTVVKGRASSKLRHMYDTVACGQEIAFKKMRALTCSSDVHKAVLSYFEEQGYKTGKINNRMQGFFHGTGHGLGLEIHESPRVGHSSAGALRPGQVVTVEPGLYYPDTGGVRLEDVALITRGAPRNLTKFEKVLEV